MNKLHKIEVELNTLDLEWIVGYDIAHYLEVLLIDVKNTEVTVEQKASKDSPRGYVYLKLITLEDKIFKESFEIKLKLNNRIVINAINFIEEKTDQELYFAHIILDVEDKIRANKGA